LAIAGQAQFFYNGCVIERSCKRGEDAATTMAAWIKARQASKMSQQNDQSVRYFVSYTGVKLPVKMVNPLEEAALSNRNTYIVANFDDQDRLIFFEKMVYGEVEISHKYEYDGDGVIRRAEIFMDEETTEMLFDAQGALLNA
jgi:hypothetical protein